MFNSEAFALLRTRVNNALAKEFSKHACPEKILFRRNSTQRIVTNIAEIENALVAKGYVIVEPEKLSFLQQVQLVSNAKIIVGSAGSAFTNILFASQNTEIFILIGKCPTIRYWYWHNIACASGTTVNYILGEIVAKKRRGSGVHADFTVNLEYVLQALNEV
ncbi:MAG: glycosyltransferase family 61 protein [Gammaproteobacteria bacterium]|nr:glycosyltransferase family 61 protein [Gammaproteobacteria bacterium]